VNFFGEVFEDILIDCLIAVASERFTTEFQQNAFVLWFGRHGALRTAWR
jgi:hypothetical protein